MAAARHNLTRRAVLGAGVGAPLALAASARAPVSTPPFGLSLSKASPSSTADNEEEGLRQAQPERISHSDEVSAATRGRWARALAAYRRAEARVAGFKAGEALLPAERRAWPACRDLEERFGDLDSLRLVALRRLLSLPASGACPERLPAGSPRAALALKLDLAVAD